MGQENRSLSQDDPLRLNKVRKDAQNDFKVYQFALAQLAKNSGDVIERGLQKAARSLFGPLVADVADADLSAWMAERHSDILTAEMNDPYQAVGKLGVKKAVFPRRFNGKAAYVQWRMLYYRVTDKMVIIWTATVSDQTTGQLGVMTGTEPKWLADEIFQKLKASNEL